MPKIYEAYLNAMNQGKEHGVSSQDIRVLIAHKMGYAEPIDTLFHKDDEFTKIQEFERDFAKLIQGMPVEYVINEATFLHTKLYVDQRVLIPRMETQELIANLSEKVVDYYDPRNYLVVADIGTGSGAILCALRSLFPNWLLVGSDVSKGALEVARKNIKDYNVNATLLEGKSLQPYIDAKMNLDIIISNPPYILNKEEVQDSVKDYEPEGALYLTPENNVYEDIFKNYKKVKKGSLLMAFEIGYDLEDMLTKMMKEYLEDYEYEFIKDLNGLTRFLFVFCR
ncbi:MAG: peptide chain release factor N(5)-glutamine methyltransferase [Bacilli bacterium]|nr:peptide chain release factor N(5)-glutamine methyltransferase [Bacilli bacterium]MBO6285804.1 peptide chain release factor N(5)-glutamine methyltransferase [Bacilli bacterium]